MKPSLPLDDETPLSPVNPDDGWDLAYETDDLADADE